MLHISELVNKLERIQKEHGDIPVAKVGHYGEANEMDLEDVYVYSPCGSSYHDKKKFGETVVNIDTPDIGPEPD